MSEVHPSDDMLELTTPSLGRRMACWLYEGMLLFGVVFISGYLFGTLSQTRHALHNRHGLQAFLFLVFAIYFTWFWSKGQTLAMKTWHIKVVDLAGQPVSQARAFLRYILSWIWILPPLVITAPLQLPPAEVAVLLVGWVVIWALLSRFQIRRQYWHDVWAGTQLVEVSQKSPAKP
ncbi:MAG: hypothetical protein RLZZ433_237 [Pseudomonadota bacterium]